MKRKTTILGLCAMLFALCVAAEAQQAKKVPLIGYLVLPFRRVAHWQAGVKRHRRSCENFSYSLFSFATFVIL